MPSTARLLLRVAYLPFDEDIKSSFLASLASFAVDVQFVQWKSAQKPVTRSVMRMRNGRISTGPVKPDFFLAVV